MTKLLRSIILCIILSTALSCAHKVVVPQVPSALPLVIEIVSKDTTLTPEQKAKLIEMAVAETSRIYARMLDRMDTEGQNWKDSLFQFFSLIASIATLIWTIK